MNVKIKRLSEYAVIPKYAKQGDSGFDLVAIQDIYIYPSNTVMVQIGLAFEIPEGYELQIRPRSGITSKTRLRVQFGTVDSGYRGGVSVTVDNVSPYFPSLLEVVKDIKGNVLSELDSEIGCVYHIKKGDRIAQGVIAPVIQATFEETDELSETERGSFGFGSTGV